MGTLYDYSPQRNGIAERFNRTVKDMGACLISYSGAPLAWWPYALSYAVYILKKCPTKGTEDPTPEEGLTKRRPSVADLKVFGCRVYVRKAVRGPKDLNEKALRGIFVGLLQGLHS